MYEATVYIHSKQKISILDKYEASSVSVIANLTALYQMYGLYNVE
jgi:hypothetical protein